MKGLIALDIDGTTTPLGQTISQEVADFLHSLIKNHWHIVFVTGRSFHFSQKALFKITYEHFLAVQNGAILLEMPSKSILKKHYINSSILPFFEKIGEQESTDFIIYTGFEHQDLCFFRPNKLKPELQNYLMARTAAYEERWQPVASFAHLPITEFPSIKFFATKPSAKIISSGLENLELHAPVIRDPFGEHYFVIQGTPLSANKGHALEEVKSLLLPPVVIAAGDDYNDKELLAKADVKVIMSTAPFDLLQTADIIAPPAEEHGIIDGLSKAIKKIYG